VRSSASVAPALSPHSTTLAVAKTQQPAAKGAQPGLLDPDGKKPHGLAGRKAAGRQVVQRLETRQPFLAARLVAIGVVFGRLGADDRQATRSFAAARRMDETVARAGFDQFGAGLAEKLFDADLRDTALQEIADGGLIFVENVHQLRLRIALGADVAEDGGKNLGLDLQRAGLGGREPQRIEDVAFDNVRGLIFRWLFHLLAAPSISASPVSGAGAQRQCPACRSCGCPSQSNAKRG